jgi:hypothetical protein
LIQVCGCEFDRLSKKHGSWQAAWLKPHHWGLQPPCHTHMRVFELFEAVAATRGTRPALLLPAAITHTADGAAQPSEEGGPFPMSTWSYAALHRLVRAMHDALRDALRLHTKIVDDDGGLAVSACVGVLVPRGPVLFGALLAANALPAPVLLVEWTGPPDRERHLLTAMPCTLVVVHARAVERVRLLLPGVPRVVGE